MSHRRSTNEVSPTARARWRSGSVLEVARRAARANRHVKSITGRILSPDAATTMFDGTKRSTHAGAAAATAVAAPRPTPGAGSESDAKTGRRSMPTTPSSVSMAVSTSSAANTMATASPRRPDRRADRPWPPIARKSCATISGRTTARRPFVHARMNESRTNRTVSVAGEEVPAMNSPAPEAGRDSQTQRHDRRQGSQRDRHG